MQTLTKKEKTQQTIINSAIGLFASLGYNATSTALIAKRADVSEGIIFKYYKNKENLLKEICAVAINQIVENISIIPFLKNVEASKEYPLKDFMRSIIKERLDFLYKNNELIKLFLIEMQYSQNLKNQAKSLVFPKIFEVFEYIKTIIAKKANIEEKQAKAVMRVVLGAISSVLFQKYLLKFKTTDEEINKDVEEILNIIEKACTKGDIL